MLASPEYGEIRQDYDAKSREFFAKSYRPPENLSFAHSPALFPDGSLRDELAAEYRAASPDRQEAILARLREAQSMLDEWASHGPGAFDAYATLLAAERARLSGDGEDADARYPRAVDTARKQSLGTVEALAAELGGRRAAIRSPT